MRVFISFFFAFCLSFGTAAQDTTPVQTEDQTEQRARNIGRALRCVVCQNQSIEESDASLAEDMRRLVRARVKSGDSNEEVIAFMQDRYGDFVLLKPPVQSNTYILWAAPFILVLLGVVWFTRQSKRRPINVTTTPLTEEELSTLENLGATKETP